MCNTLKGLLRGTDENFGLAVPGIVLFMPVALSSVWGHSVHFAKFPMLRSAKGYCSHSFYLISTKLCDKYTSDGGIYGLTFYDLPKIKILWHLQFLLAYYGAGDFKAPLLKFLSDLNQAL